MTLKNSNLTRAFIDARIFHPAIVWHIRKNALYAFSYITENDIVELVDPILSFLFHQCPHLHLHKNGKYQAIFLYYTLEDFIEQYDELILEFTNLLYFEGINRYSSYDVYRLDNFRTLFIERDPHEKTYPTP